MEDESANRALPWSWVIEALARSELVDIGLLYELGPQLLGDSGIAAKEATALRCLEDLCASPKRAPHSQFPLDPAHTCQDVLHRFWHETGNLQKDASEELIWSIQTFVKHKRASFPNCTLELLKDMILEGNHSFLKEIGGLVLGDQCGLNITSNSGDPMYPQPTSVNIPHPSETLPEEVNICSPRPEIDDQLSDVKISNGSSGPSKSGTNGCYIDNHIQEIDFDNVGPPGKKHKLQKQCGMQFKQQHSVSSDGSKFSDGINDESNNPLNKANEMCGKESSEITVGRQAKTSTINYHLPGMSPDNSGCCHHQTAAAMNKAIFSSSQCLLSQYSIKITDTEANLCMKCNEGGQLLSCCESTCPLLLHESCLGCFVSFDDHGNFYCPICAYSRAISDYVKAKEKVSLTRKELTLFFGGDPNNQPRHDHNRSLDDDLDLQRHENRENAAGLQDGADVVQVAKSH